MYVCLICRWEVPYDDAVCALASGRCICLRCYLVYVEDRRQMPAWWRREFEAALAQ